MSDPGRLFHMPLSRRAVLRGLVAGSVTAGGALVLPAPAAAGGPVRAVAAHDATAAARWMRTAYRVVAASGTTPPTAARAYAVVFVAAYEALLGGMPAHRTLQGQLTDLTSLPPPADPATVDWPLVLSSSAASVLRALFPTVATEVEVAAGEQEDIEQRTAAGVSQKVVAASRAHGAATAQAVLQWAGQDGHAQASAKAATYVPPAGEGLWVPTPPNFGRAIEPYCAEIRPLLLRTADEVAPVPHVPFATTPGSPFYAQAWATYEQSRTNTDETRDIARFWTDNPVFSGLPAGHWLHIVVQVAEQHRLRLHLTVEALVRTAVALHDAFLNCWTWKYRYNVLRPVTYVRAYGIAADWNTWVNTPQFPEYTSGHSVASAAASRVLTDLFGPKRFDDRTLATTQGIVRSTRSFGSFEDAAAMAAQSRLYGGIHFPMGISAGLDQGERIGELVVSRLRTRHA